MHIIFRKGFIVRNIKVTLAGIVAAALMFNGVVSAESDAWRYEGL